MKIPYIWIILVDDALNLKGNGVRVVLEDPNNLLSEKSIIFEFKVNNNQAEYEALIMA